MSALDLIEDFQTLTTVTVSRFAVGSYVSGVYVPGATQSFDVVASIQPLTGTERIDLPEGQRTKNLRKIYSPVELFTSQQVASKKPDVIDFEGKHYEVIRVDSWGSVDSEIDPYWRAFIAEQNPS